MKKLVTLSIVILAIALGSGCQKTDKANDAPVRGDTIVVPNENKALEIAKQYADENGLDLTDNMLHIELNTGYWIVHYYKAVDSKFKTTMLLTISAYTGEINQGSVVGEE